MSTMVYIKNDSPNSFMLHIHKHQRVQLNGGQLYTYPVGQLVPKFNEVLARCLHTVDGERVPAIRHGYYRPSEISHEDLVEMVEMGLDVAEWNDNKPTPDKTVYELLDDLQIITEDQLTGMSQEELRYVNAKLGSTIDGSVDDLKQYILDMMSNWSSIDVSDRVVLTDDEANLRLGD